MVRPEVRALAPYSLDCSPCRHKLDQNEVPWDLPRRLKREIAERWLGRDWARYPDFHAEALRRALGARWGWPSDGVLVGNGSNELLQAAIGAFVAPGGELLSVAPSFGLYRGFAVKSGARLVEVASPPALGLPWAGLLAEAEREPRRPVLLCSPNNPTGAAASPQQVEALLERLEAPLLLDNAYGEFCRHDYRPLLDRHEHLVLFRTFSKAWSIAGVRLGYLLAAPALVAELLKVKLPYNLGHAAAAAGEAVLAAEELAHRRVRILVARRSQWAAMLRSCGLEVVPSEANFLLVRCASTAAAKRLYDGLAARGIRVRDVGRHAALAGCLRVSVGGGAALRATRRALQELRA
jgi:histidinol-phosphate aminotransferase